MDWVVLPRSKGIGRCMHDIIVIRHTSIGSGRADEATHLGTLDNPITVPSYGEERYLGCTGYPADSHVVIWLTVSKDRPIERCPECGSVYKMNYVGPEESHDHHHGDRTSPPHSPLFSYILTSLTSINYRRP